MFQKRSQPCGWCRPFGSTELPCMAEHFSKSCRIIFRHLLSMQNFDVIFFQIRPETSPQVRTIPEAWPNDMNTCGRIAASASMRFWGANSRPT